MCDEAALLPETDSLYIELMNAPSAKAREILTPTATSSDSTSTTLPASSICPTGDDRTAAAAE
jgi:hypothetical protein